MLPCHAIPILKPCAGANSPRQRLHQAGIGAQIRNVRGDGRRRRAENARQAEQGHLHIVRRQGRAARDELVGAGNTGEQSRQERLALKEDSAATFLDHGQVADELDGIAQALLGIHENGFAFQGGAVPARPGERARRHVGLRPALLVILPAAREIAHEQAQQRTLPAGRRLVGTEPQGVVDVQQRFFEKAQARQSDGETVVRVRMLGRKAQHVPVAQGRFGELLLVLEGVLPKL